MMLASLYATTIGIGLLLLAIVHLENDDLDANRVVRIATMMVAIGVTLAWGAAGAGGLIEMYLTVTSLLVCALVISHFEDERAALTEAWHARIERHRLNWRPSMHRIDRSHRTRIEKVLDGVAPDPRRRVGPSRGELVNEWLTHAPAHD